MTDQRHLIAPEGMIPTALDPVVQALAHVAIDLARTIASGPLGGTLGAEVGNNSDGDSQKALDVMADEAFAAALRGSGVRWYASEERDSVEELSTDGALALAIDPLDGSSNIDVNVSIGTIFAIRPALESAEGSFLRPGHEQLAAGYFIYGPQTGLAVTFGDGVQMFVLDPADGLFKLVNPAVRVPPTAKEFAINASNYRHWTPEVRAYIDHCLAGEEGPHEKNFNMRWVASLVAETHRILSRGGIFLYPSDARPGYEQGRLRMVYECAPIAMLAEQAGGAATEGKERLLDQVPDSLHARAPLIFGSSEKVERVTSYHR